MPRQLRLEFPGSFYHVMARGDRREAIFHDDSDRLCFLELLGRACGRTGWRVHAWVLMGNHYHLLLETPEPNLVAGMRWLQTTYTRCFNHRHRLWGHLFGGRYKAALVEGGRMALPLPAGTLHGGGDYFLAVMDYIHLNPVRARLARVHQGNGLLDYPWSSLAQGYARAASKRDKWLATDAGLNAAGLADHARGRRAFVERLEARVREEGAAKAGSGVGKAQGLQSTLRRGWYFGSQAFREQLLKAAKTAGRALGRRGDAYEGARVQRDHAEEQAERLVQAALALLGTAEAELAARARGDDRTGLVATLVRKRTSVSLDWIAKRLHLRSASNASQAIRRSAIRIQHDAQSRRRQRALDQMSDQLS